jgi:hypothetical protein
MEIKITNHSKIFNFIEELSQIFKKVKNAGEINESFNDMKDDNILIWENNDNIHYESNIIHDLRCVLSQTKIDKDSIMTISEFLKFLLKYMSGVNYNNCKNNDLIPYSKYCLNLLKNVLSGANIMHINYAMEIKEDGLEEEYEEILVTYINNT